jgi:hypothetical protein
MDISYKMDNVWGLFGMRPTPGFFAAFFPLFIAPGTVPSPRERPAGARIRPSCRLRRSVCTDHFGQPGVDRLEVMPQREGSGGIHLERRRVVERALECAVGGDVWNGHVQCLEDPAVQRRCVEAAFARNPAKVQLLQAWLTEEMDEMRAALAATGP